MYGTRLLKNVSKVQNIDETVIYLLVCRERFISDLGWTTVYGINVYRYLGDRLCESCEIEDYSSNFDFSWRLLQNLWHGGIKPEQARYVVEDHLL